jgi:PAS domain S-box-containing protein
LPKEQIRGIRPKDLGIGGLFESVRDVIIVADASTGQITLWNSAATKVFGYSPSEALGLRVEALIPERLKAQHRAGITRYRTTGHGYYIDSDEPLDLPALRKTGEEIRIEMTLSPISPVHDDSKDGPFVLAVIRDVTERKRAQEELRRLNEDLENRIAERTKRLEALLAERKQSEERLRHSEERFRSLVQNASDIISILEADGTIRYVSPALERVTGYHPEERVGTSIFSAVHPNDLERASSIFTKILKTPGVHQPLEFRVSHKYGSWCYLEHVVNNLLHEPAIKGIVINSRNITERKRAEEALRESEAKYRTLIEQIPAITYVEAIDEGEPEHNILYVSPQIEDLLGYSAEEWRTVPELWAGLLHPDDRDRVLAEDARTEETGKAFSAEYRCFTKDGRIVWLYDEAVLVPDDSGRPLYWQGVKYDITERKKAEEELREANRRLKELAVLKADFTAMVAHELDAPLAVIRGYAEMLATGKLDPAEQSRALTKIQAEIEVLNTHVADVRAAAAVEREDFTIEPQRVPVRALLESAAHFGATLPGNHPLVIENVADERVWADATRLRQVLRNLLSNAAKYSPDGTPIELRAKPGDTPGRIRIEVADYGYGIHSDDVGRVFEKFGRGRDRCGRQVAGVGLGLYLSRRIMQAHGSDLTLNSVSGDGSVFGFELEVVQ